MVFQVYGIGRPFFANPVAMVDLIIFKNRLKCFTYILHLDRLECAIFYLSLHAAELNPEYKMRGT